MAYEPITVIPREAQVSDEAQPIGFHIRRVMARIEVNQAYLNALKIDPSLSHDTILRDAMLDNVSMIEEELGK